MADEMHDSNKARNTKKRRRRGEGTKGRNGQNNAPEEGVPELVPSNVAHGLGDGVERDVLPFLEALPPDVDRKLLVGRVEAALRRVVREEQENALRQDTALKGRN